MKYKIIVAPWTSGLNELLNAQRFKYDPRTRKMRVFNTEKTKNQKLIRNCIVKQGLSKVKLNPPLAIHYHIFAKDKKHDRQNIGSCCEKCFADALQELKMLKNDGWNEIVKISFDYDIDAKNPRAEITITELLKEK